MVLGFVYGMGCFSEPHIYNYTKTRTENTGKCSHPHPYRWRVLTGLKKLPEGDNNIRFMILIMFV